MVCRVGTPVLLGAAAALLLLFGAATVEGVHLRGGTLTWDVEEPTLDGWIVEVSGTVVWHTSTTPWANPPYPGLIGGCGQAFEWQEDRQAGACYEVVQVDSQGQWFESRIVSYACSVHPQGPDCRNGVLINISTTWQDGPYYFVGWGVNGGGHCCRIQYWDGHINNPGAHQYMGTVVELPPPPSHMEPPGSPRAFMPPLYSCNAGALCRIPVLTHDPAGEDVALTWGSLPYLKNATLNNHTLEVMWDLRDRSPHQQDCSGLYSAQVHVTRESGASVPVDFMLRICNQPPPYWVHPTPCGHRLVFPAQERSSFMVRARHDYPNHVVQIFHSPLDWLRGDPAFAPASGNPAQATFSWTPPLEAVGKTFRVGFYAESQGTLTRHACPVDLMVTRAPHVHAECVRSPGSPSLHVQVRHAVDAHGLGPIEGRLHLGDGTVHPIGEGTGHREHRFEEPGQYTVVVEAINKHGYTSTATANCPTHPNQPPHLDPLEDIVVVEGDAIRFVVRATDPDGHPVSVTWRPENLHPAARFTIHEDGAKGVFHWQTGPGSAGEYGPVRFVATERTMDVWTAERQVNITVLPPGSPSAPSSTDSSGDGVPDHLADCPHQAGPGPDACAEGQEGTDAPQPHSLSLPPCGPGEGDPDQVHAVPVPGAGVEVAWSPPLSCAPEAFRVWMGAGEDAVALVASAPDSEGYRILHGDPWLHEPFRYHVQAVRGPEDPFDGQRAVASGLVDLRCNGLPPATAPCMEEDAGPEPVLTVDNEAASGSHGGLLRAAVVAAAAASATALAWILFLRRRDRR